MPADRGLLSTVRELLLAAEEPPTSDAVAAAVGMPEEYSDFVERRLELNEERGLVVRDEDGRWLLTPAGTSLAAR